MRALPEGGYALFAALRGGATLGEAAAPLLAAGGDPGAHLVGLIEAGAVAGCADTRRRALAYVAVPFARRVLAA